MRSPTCCQRSTLVLTQVFMRKYGSEGSQRGGEPSWGGGGAGELMLVHSPCSPCLSPFCSAGGLCVPGQGQAWPHLASQLPVAASRGLLPAAWRVRLDDLYLGCLMQSGGVLLVAGWFTKILRSWEGCAGPALGSTSWPRG